MGKIVIMGSGGHAKSIVDILEREGVYEIAGFVDRDIDEGYVYKGYSIIGTDEDLEEIYAQGIHNIAMGIGYLGEGFLRDRLYDRLKSIGYKFPIIIDTSAVIASDAEIGEGTVVAKRAVINAGAKIGRLAIINSGAIVEHECVVEDFSHIAVGAILCGNVRVGSHSLVGAGATVIQGIEIGDECIVGAGSTVLKKIQDGSKVYGVVKP